MGGGWFGGVGPEPTAAGGWGFGWQSPQPPEALGSGGLAPALENFAFFCKTNLILGLYFDKKIMLLKCGLEIGSANMTKLVA